MHKSLPLNQRKHSPQQLHRLAPHSLKPWPPLIAIQGRQGPVQRTKLGETRVDKSIPAETTGEKISSGRELIYPGRGIVEGYC